MPVNAVTTVTVRFYSLLRENRSVTDARVVVVREWCFYSLLRENRSVTSETKMNICAPGAVSIRSYARTGL